jgi:hypothetical protein
VLLQIYSAYDKEILNTSQFLQGKVSKAENH